MQTFSKDYAEKKSSSWKYHFHKKYLVLFIKCSIRLGYPSMVFWLKIFKIIANSSTSWCSSWTKQIVEKKILIFVLLVVLVPVFFFFFSYKATLRLNSLGSRFKIAIITLYLQKRSFISDPEKNYSEKFHKIHRKSPVSRSLLIKLLS